MSRVDALRAPAAPVVPLRAETVATLRLAVPLATAQLAQITINTTDVLLLGRLGAAPLASASLGYAVFHALLLLGMGVVMATSILFSQALGARRPLLVRRVLQQSWFVVGLICVPLLLLLTQIRPFLALIGQDPALLEGTERFTFALMGSLPPALVLVLLRCFTTAFGTSRPVIVVTLGGIVLNAFLGYGLIFGGFGLPRLELIGAGLASTLSHLAMAAALLFWCVRDPRFRRYVVPYRPRLDPELMGRIVRLGLPVGLTLVMEAGLFSASGLLTGRLGAVPLAAHQVTLQICSTLFMVPIGIAQACTIRVGWHMGAGDRAAARLAGFVACGVGAAFMTLVAVSFLLGSGGYVSLFLGGEDGASRAAASIAVTLLYIAALFQLVDGIQVIGNAALRGLGDTRVPMLIALAGYWGIGFPVALVLGLLTPLGAPGVWIGLAFALSTVSLLFLRRFDRLTRPSAPA